MLKGKARIVLGDLALNRRQAVETGLEVDQVLEAHALVRRVGKGRVEMLSSRRHAKLQGIDEVERAPATDTGLLVGRDIGHVEGAKWSLEATPAGEQLLLLGLAIVA